MISLMDAVGCEIPCKVLFRSALKPYDSTTLRPTQMGLLLSGHHKGGQHNLVQEQTNPTQLAMCSNGFAKDQDKLLEHNYTKSTVPWKLHLKDFPHTCRDSEDEINRGQNYRIHRPNHGKVPTPSTTRKNKYQKIYATSLFQCNGRLSDRPIRDGKGLNPAKMTS